MIKKTEVKTYIERFLCKNCNIEMKQENIVLLTCPAQYKYKCSKCNFEDNSYENYPKITYEDVEIFTKGN